MSFLHFIFHEFGCSFQVEVNFEVSIFDENVLFFDGSWIKFSSKEKKKCLGDNFLMMRILSSKLSQGRKFISSRRSLMRFKKE